MSQNPSEVYARLLLPKRHGYPLWIPEPNRQLPIEYREKGVSIGDVGIITPDGAFDFLFNICLPAGHPVNSDGVPDGFEQLALGPRDTFEVEDMHDPGSDIASMSIKKTHLSLEGATSENPLIGAGFGGGFRFTCTTSEGAILMLPDGGCRENLCNLTKFRQHALRNAILWYEYVNGPLGREASNGSIYLITGCDKVKSWGVASFSNVSDEHGISLTFTAVGATEGSASYAYSWETFSPAAVRTGPKRGDLVQSIAENQCIFMRGFKLALREGAWAKLFGPVQLSLVVDAKPKDMLRKSGHIPFAESWLSSLFGRWSAGSSSGNGQKRSPAQEAAEDDNDLDEVYDGDVLTDHIPDALEPYHPSQVINEFLLESASEAQVSITHDDVWCSLIEDVDETFPDPSELVRRVCSNYKIVVDSGGVFLDKLAEVPSIPNVLSFAAHEISTISPHLTALTTPSESTFTSTGPSQVARNVHKSSTSPVMFARAPEPIRTTRPGGNNVGNTASASETGAASSEVETPTPDASTSRSTGTDTPTDPASGLVPNILKTLIPLALSTAIPYIMSSTSEVGRVNDTDTDGPALKSNRTADTPPQSHAASPSAPVLSKNVHLERNISRSTAGPSFGGTGDVLLWTNSDPRVSQLYTSYGALYRFDTTSSPPGKTITTLWRSIREDKVERVAELQWAPNGGLGRAIIGRSIIPMADLLRPEHRIHDARSFIGVDGYQYCWRPSPTGSVLQDHNGTVIASFVQTRLTRYQFGDVYGELHFYRSAGAGTVMHPPMMDTVVVSSLLYRLYLMSN